MPQLCEHLTNTTAATSTIAATMQVLLKLTDKRPELVLDHFDKIKKATQETPSTISLAAQILSTAGKVNKVIIVKLSFDVVCKLSMLVT